MLHPVTHFGSTGTLLQGLRCWCPLTEAAGTTRLDASGNANHFSDNNTVGQGMGLRNATCADLERTAFFHRLTRASASSADFRLTGSRTFALRLKAESLPGSQFPQVACRDAYSLAANREWSIVYAVAIGAFYYVAYDTSGNTIAAVLDGNYGTLSTETWVTLIWGYDAAQNKLFLEVDDTGIQWSSALTASPNTTGVAPTSLGARYSSPTFVDADTWDGEMEDFAAWNRVLTQAERADYRTPKTFADL